MPRFFCAHHRMTDWESCYVEGHTPWDKGIPSPPLTAWVGKYRPEGKALVPGCGIGHDVVMLAQAGMDAHGVDIATTAVQRAQATHPDHAARFHLGDLFALSQWQASFDYVFEHTCLCALPPSMRQDYVRAVHALLKPGGLLVGVWFINPDMEPEESGPPFGLPVPELDQLFFSSEWTVIEDYVPESAYEGRAGRERVRVLRKQS